MAHSAWTSRQYSELIIAPGNRQHLCPRPDGMANGQRGLNEHRAAAFSLDRRSTRRRDGLRGHTYRKGGGDDARLFEAMTAATYLAADPRSGSLTILAALGPRMMALSGELADGAHPSKGPRTHRRGAPNSRGPARACKEVWVLLESVQKKAAVGRGRRSGPVHAARTITSIIGGRLGFGDEDCALAGGGFLATPMCLRGPKRASPQGIQELGTPAPTCLHSVDQPGRLARPREDLAMLSRERA